MNRHNTGESLRGKLRDTLSQKVEAYRVLFALGGLHAIIGAGVWVLSFFDLISSPILVHPYMMSGGFLLSFAFGFLWTAVPRFTQSRMPSLAELIPLVLSGIATLVAELCMRADWLLFFLLSSSLISLRFLASRYLERKQDPPESFLFVGVALIVGTASLAVLWISNFVSIEPTLFSFARSFFLKGFMLFLVLGVGFRLIPAILGVNAPQKMEVMSVDGVLAELRKKQRGTLWQNRALIVAVLLAFALESLSYIRLSAALLAAAMLWSGLRGFHFYRVPSWSNPFALIVWLSVLSVLLTPLLIVLFPERAVHLWHLYFIGGLGLMTIMVSLRVSVSHSGVAVAHVEEKKPYIKWIGALLVLSALTRLSVAWWPETLSSHYLYAASVWVIALLIWFRHFLSYTIRAEQKRRMLLREAASVASVSST